MARTRVAAWAFAPLGLLTFAAGCASSAIEADVGVDSASAPDAGPVDVTVELDLDVDRGPVTNRLGYLHSLSVRNDAEALALLRPLAPATWRANDAEVFALEAAVGELEVELVLSDGFLAAYAPPVQVAPACSAGSGCFASDDALVTAWTDALTIGLDALAASGAPVDQLDVMNEPNGSFYVSDATLLRLYRVAHDLIRAKLPGVRIVGPSTSGFPEPFAGVLGALAESDVHLDRLSWHEFGMPEDIPAHVAAARTAIASVYADRPALAPRGIEINEVASGQHHLIPGWQLGFRYYLDLASVDATVHACWAPSAGGPSECAGALDGLFLPDGHTPQPSYWVDRMVASQTGVRIPATSPDPHLVVLASRDDDAQQLRLLVGRYSCGASGLFCTFADHAVVDTPAPRERVALHVAHVPAGPLRIRTTRIPATFEARALREDDLASETGDATSEGDVTLAVSIDDGEVIELVVDYER